MTKSRKSPLAKKPEAKTASAVPQHIPPLELLKKLPDGIPDELRISIEASLNSPLPSPSALREYEEILPESANRLLTLAEKEQKHRHSWENRALRDAVPNANATMGLGFILALACVGGIVFLSIAGYWIGSVSLAFLGATAIAGYKFLSPRMPNRRGDHREN